MVFSQPCTAQERYRLIAVEPLMDSGDAVLGCWGQPPNNGVGWMGSSFCES